jgi:hypothetical protein
LESGVVPAFKGGHPKEVASGVFAATAMALMIISALWIKARKSKSKQ